MALSQNENIVARFIAIILGTTFSWLDLLAYLIGIVSVIIGQFIALYRKDMKSAVNTMLRLSI